ncbi:MAG: ABC transporter permease [Acidobacteria bacterium]|nr:ABC transporter permease [Acidobacteriota bacterium]
MTLHESIVDGLVDVRTNKLRTLLQTIGVILGVASLVAVQGLVDAGRRQSIKFFNEVGGLTKVLVHGKRVSDPVQTARQLASTGLTWDDARAIREEVREARLVDPAVDSYQPVRRGEFAEVHEITGVTADYPDVYKFYPVRGRFLTADDIRSAARVCVLGDTAARRYFGGEDPLGQVLYIGGTGFRVAGIMQRKEFYFNQDYNALEWMNRLTFVPITAVFARFTGDAERRVDYINVVIDDVEHNTAAARAIEGVLLRRHALVRDFEIIDRSDRMRRRSEQNQVFDITFLACGIVSLLVGGIVIMNIMLSSFHERVREIGVRKALGAKGSDIAAQFLVEAVLVTVIGGLAGLALGLGFARAISTLLEAPAVITPRMALVGVAASVGVGLFFGVYPALRAARLNPVDALRYE